MTGIVPFSLADGFLCGACGRPKSQRLFGILTGCKTCDEVITRHRCTERPDLEALADGEVWECPDCGSRWTPHSGEEECPDCCAECGHRVTVRRWGCEEGDRLDTAPRYEAPAIGFTPFRNALPPGRRCYRTASGLPVHYRGCECPR